MTKYYVTPEGHYIGAFDGTFVPGEPVEDEDGNLVPGELVYLFPEIPAGATEVPIPPMHASDIWDFQAGAWDAAHALAALKATLKARLDADAETERLKYITAGAGQAMEYQQAAAEADLLLTAVAADPEHEPDPLQYPMLFASVGIDGDTLVDVATTVATMHGQWRVIGSAIRAARLAGKEEIDAAPTAEAAQAAFDAVEWPVPS